MAEGWSQSPDTGCWEWVGVKEEESTGASSAVADCSTSHGAAAAAPPAAIAGKVASSSAEEDGLACLSGGGKLWRRSRGSAACGGSSGLIHVREAPARGMKSLEEERRCEANKTYSHVRPLPQRPQLKAPRALRIKETGASPRREAKKKYRPAAAAAPERLELRPHQHGVLVFEGDDRAVG